MDRIRSLQLIALKNILIEADEDYRWRQIARWYSKTFATPLHEVDDLPRIDVLQHYIEDKYEDIDEAALSHEVEKLLNIEDETKQAIVKSQEDAAMDALENEIKQSKNKPNSKQVAIEKPNKIQLPQEVLDSLATLGTSITDIEKAVQEDKIEFPDL